MAAEQIDCRPFFYPLELAAGLSGTEQARRAQAQNTVSYAQPAGHQLPCGLNVTESIVVRVAQSLQRILADQACRPVSSRTAA